MMMILRDSLSSSPNREIHKQGTQKTRMEKGERNTHTVIQADSTSHCENLLSFHSSSRFVTFSRIRSSRDAYFSEAPGVHSRQ